MATILIVDDEADCRRPLAALLKHEGYEIVEARDGFEGLQRLNEKKIDLVLLDMLMPKLHGLDVMRALKAEERTRSIPVLVLSNSSRERDVQEIMKLGAVGYLVKANLSLQELGNRVAELLGG